MSASVQPPRLALAPGHAENPELALQLHLVAETIKGAEVLLTLAFEPTMSDAFKWHLVAMVRDKVAGLAAFTSSWPQQPAHPFFRSE